ncbi:hypothetical protein GE09DRAFT_1071853 [Coniochaeta sp. 2T2.1]|nr:hypothetical protein GE09DRAFT_1071853 [Coniochaeta sp. 2T2.1]
MGSDDGTEPTRQDAERPYHSKRPHRKSRAGCRNCKTRKVKCDEARPSCRACTLRKEKCSYPATAPPSVSASPKSSRASPALSGRSSRHDTPVEEINRSDQSMILLTGPTYTPPNTDVTDMKLLWFYTLKTYESFNIRAKQAPVIDDILQVKIIQIAFTTPFLMDTILGISAQHMQHLNVPVPSPKAIAHRASAFEGYRKAIEEANPDTYPALLCTSLLLCAVSTAQFREEDARPLYILDWMLVWRGIGLIIELVKPEILLSSGLEALFFRPPIDLDISALHIPPNLLFMVTSLKEGDEDYPNVEIYYNTLKYLGALHRELQNGFSGILDLGIITFYTFLPREFIDLARRRRPPALVIVAHHLCFVRLTNGPWWMEGIADREIDNVCNLLDSGDPNRPPTEWTPFLRVPRTVSRLQAREEIARVLLDDRTWTPPIVRGDAADDERTKEIRLVDDSGRGVSLVDGNGNELAYRGQFLYSLPSRGKQPPGYDVWLNEEDASKATWMDDGGVSDEYMRLVRASSEVGSGSSGLGGSTSSDTP